MAGFVARLLTDGPPAYVLLADALGSCTPSFRQAYVVRSLANQFAGSAGNLVSARRTIGCWDHLDRPIRRRPHGVFAMASTEIDRGRGFRHCLHRNLASTSAKVRRGHG